MTNNSPEPETLDDGLTTGSFSAFLNAVSELSKRIIDSKAPLKEKFLLVVLFLTVIFGGLGTVVFLIAGQWNYLLATIGSVIGVLFILGFVAVIKTDFNEQPPSIGTTEREQVPEQVSESARSQRVIWQRVVPNWDCFSEDNIEEIRSELDNIRRHAFARLTQKDQKVNPDHLRANIFCPYYSGVAATSGNVCELRLVEALSVNMKGHSDRKISFRPNQGLTGKVFVEQKAKFGAAIEKEGAYTWEDEYELTPELEKTVHDDLRWIVSFPLQLEDDGAKRTFAVLNIDGLETTLSPEILEDLTNVLLTLVAPITDKMSKLDMVRVSISLEEVNS